MHALPLRSSLPASTLPAENTCASAFPDCHSGRLSAGIDMLAQGKRPAPVLHLPASALPAH
eukprot:scaffold8726_cov33-Tisochrysis_lutea.AAC.1